MNPGEMVQVEVEIEGERQEVLIMAEQAAALERSSTVGLGTDMGASVQTTNQVHITFS